METAKYTIGQLRNKIFQGDVLEVLKRFPDESIDCIITSPPYWGLRFYGEKANTVWGGDPDCEHEWEYGEARHDNLRPSKVSDKTIVGSNRELGFRVGERVGNSFCKKCGAWYGQLGLEPSLDLYIEHMLQITAELKRVLKKTGVMFWNHGNSYRSHSTGRGNVGGIEGKRRNKHDNLVVGKGRISVPDKCMTMQNYRLVLKLLDDLRKWELRDDLTEEEREYVIRELTKAGVLK